jgi:hypothetical protein
MQAVDDFAQVHGALVAAAFGGRDQRRDQIPFQIRDVAALPMRAPNETCALATPCSAARLQSVNLLVTSKIKSLYACFQYQNKIFYHFDRGRGWARRQAATAIFG